MLAPPLMSCADPHALCHLIDVTPTSHAPPLMPRSQEAAGEDEEQAPYTPWSPRWSTSHPEDADVVNQGSSVASSVDMWGADGLLDDDDDVDSQSSAFAAYVPGDFSQPSQLSQLPDEPDFDFSQPSQLSQLRDVPDFEPMDTKIDMEIKVVSDNAAIFEAGEIYLDGTLPSDCAIPQSTRPRVVSKLSYISFEVVHRELRTRGFIDGVADPDGNCAQRAAGCSVGWLTVSEAQASLDPILSEKLVTQRKEIVEKVLSPHCKVMRAELGLTNEQMIPFLRLNHWDDGSAPFIAFMWGIGDNLGRPVVVLHCMMQGYANPLCVYNAGGPALHNGGAFAYITLEELSTCLHKLGTYM